MSARDQAEAATIAAVVERMEQLAAGLQPADGVARFNDLYLAVTRAVLAETRAGEFERPELLARLDVVFAGLYFAAVDADAGGRPLAHAWRPLFRTRRSRHVAPLQFALAGMNAHINHDLPLALVAVMGQFGVRPERGTPHHRDYLRVNALLAKVEAQVKRRFQDELPATLARPAVRRRSPAPRSRRTATSRGCCARSTPLTATRAPCLRRTAGRGVGAGPSARIASKQQPD